MKVGTDAVLLGAWAGRDFTSGKESDAPCGDAPCSDAHPDSNSGNTPKILDVGCGTGVIALMMAQRFPSAQIYGIEIDPDAAVEAAGNFANSPWADRLSAINGDFTSHIFPQGANGFDIIVSNPPFFTEGCGALPGEDARKMARHDSSLSLPSLLSKATELLAPAGHIYLIMPAECENDIIFESTMLRLSVNEICAVSTVPRKPPRRIMVDLSLLSSSAIRPASALSIHTPDGGFSPEYTSLVKDFYLHF